MLVLSCYIFSGSGMGMRCRNVPVENNANRFLLYPILRVSSSYTLISWYKV